MKANKLLFSAILLSPFYSFSKELPPEKFAPVLQAPNSQDIMNDPAMQDGGNNVVTKWEAKSQIKTEPNEYIYAMELARSRVNDTQLLYVENNSYLLDSIINSLQVTLRDGGTAINTVVKGDISNDTQRLPGVLSVNDGTTTFGTVVDDNGSLGINSGGKAYDTTVKTGGRMVIGSQGYAQASLIDGGLQQLSAMSTAKVEDTVVINGGEQLIYGGTAVNSHIGEGSYQLASGLSDKTSVYDGGYQLVYAGSGDTTVADRDSIIYAGGTQRVQAGVAENTKVYGEQTVSARNGNWRNGQWEESSSILSRQQTALNATLYTGGVQRVETYGKAEGTLVDGGTQSVGEFGHVIDTTVQSGGSANIAFGGYASGQLAIKDGTLNMQGGDSHSWSGSYGKGAYAENVALESKNSNLIIQHNALTSESAVTIGSLVNNGSVTFGRSDGSENGSYSRLDLKNLSGTGLFVMNTDLSGGIGDFLNVSDSISGNFDVKVFDSGHELAGSGATPYHLIYANGSSNDSFSLVNSSVDLGAYKYYLVQGETTDQDNWYLSPTPITPPDPEPEPGPDPDPNPGPEPGPDPDPNPEPEPGPDPDPNPEPEPGPDPDPTPEPGTDPEPGDNGGGTIPPTTKPDLSEGAKSVIALANATPTIWNSELATLRSRMGELHTTSKAQTGVWGRTITNRNRISTDYVAYKHDMYGIMLGADRLVERTDSRLHLGGLFSYTHSKLDAKTSDGKIDSYAIGAYASWLHDNGFYMDGIIKANYFKTENSASFNGGRTHGSDNANGMGLSLEAGKYITHNTYFVESYLLGSFFRAGKSSYTMDSGLKARADTAQSLKAEAGATMGKTFTLENGAQVQPYLRLAVSHEFKKNNSVTINDTEHFKNDMSGTVGKYGLGITTQLNNQWAAYGEINYANGDHVETPYSGHLGIRYSF